MMSLKFAAAALLVAALMLFLSLQLDPEPLSKELESPVSVNISSTEISLTNSLDWENFPSVAFIYRSEENGEIEIWRQSSELKINITLPEIEGNLLYKRMKQNLTRTITESLKSVKDAFDAKYIPAAQVLSEQVISGKRYLREIRKSSLDLIDVQKFQKINKACEDVAGSKPFFELEWTFYFLIKAKIGDQTFERIFPVRYSFNSSNAGTEAPRQYLGFEANISDIEVNLAEYLHRGCFPAVSISLRSEKAGFLEIWREPSTLEYPMPPFDANEWLPDLSAMRVELFMREFIRKTQSDFEEKYGKRKLVHSAPVEEGKEYRFVVAPPDIPMFQSFTLNLTEDACSIVNTASSNNEGWNWTFNYTVTATAGILKGEKELSVHYVW